jgi:hypothetical protein
MDNAPEAPAAAGARPQPGQSPICPHCHRPVVVEAFSPRWNGYCDACAQALSNHPHLESA